MAHCALSLFYLLRLSTAARDKRTIRQAFDDYHKYTCLKFKPAGRKNRRKIYFTDGSGCASYVGSSGGRQPVSLSRGCRRVIIRLTMYNNFHHDDYLYPRRHQIFIFRLNAMGVSDTTPFLEIVAILICIFQNKMI